MSVTRAAAAARRTSVPSPTPPRRWLTIPAGLAACCARKLKLSDAQLRVVYRRFCSVDADRSGQISAKEFFTLIGAVDTPFVRVLIDRMVFDWADLNVDNQLSFEEFVLAACTVCTFTRTQILRFIFDIFDTDGSGAIGRTEFRAIAQCITDLGGLFPGNYGSFLDQFDTSGDGTVDFNEFAGVNDSFPMLFFPAMKLQNEFSKSTLGPNLWRDLVNKFDETDDSVPAVSLHQQMVLLGMAKIEHANGEIARGGEDDE